MIVHRLLSDKTRWNCLWNMSNIGDREFLHSQEHLTSQSCPVLPYHVEVDSAGYRTLQILHSVSKLNLCAWDNLWRGLRDLSSCAILKPQVRKQGNRPTFIGIENKENQDARS